MYRHVQVTYLHVTDVRDVTDHSSESCHFLASGLFADPSAGRRPARAARGCTPRETLSCNSTLVVETRAPHCTTIDQPSTHLPSVESAGTCCHLRKRIGRRRVATEWATIMDQQAQASLRPLSCVQEAGDVLVLPEEWAHATANEEVSIGGAIEFTRVR